MEKDNNIAILNWLINENSSSMKEWETITDEISTDYVVKDSDGGILHRIWRSSDGSWMCDLSYELRPWGIPLGSGSPSPGEAFLKAQTAVMNHMKQLLEENGLNVTQLCDNGERRWKIQNRKTKEFRNRSMRGKSRKHGYLYVTAELARRQWISEHEIHDLVEYMVIPTGRIQPR